MVVKEHIGDSFLHRIAVRLVGTLGSTELVHLLLEMVEPKTIVHNILLTKKEQDRLSHTTGRTHREMVCFECTEIHDKLLAILDDCNLKIDDIV